MQKDTNRHIPTHLRLPLAAILAAMLALGACTFFRAPGTDDCDKVLSREQMVGIMTDLYLVESYLVKYQQVNRTISADSGKYYYRGIFHRHDVDPEEFQEALDCYLLDFKEMDRIHEEVLRRLSILESEAEQLPELDLLRQGQ